MKSNTEIDDKLQSNCLKIPREFLKIMSATDALYYCYLLEFFQSDKSVKEDGWFICSREEVFAGMGMSDQRQSHSMSRMRKLGYVSTKKVGLPPIRWIKLNPEKVLSDLQKHKR